MARRRPLVGGANFKEITREKLEQPAATGPFNWRLLVPGPSAE